MSLVLILISFLMSQHALRREMEVLSGRREPDKHPGGWLGKATTTLNWLAALVLISGVAALVRFTLHNLERG